MMWFKNLHIFTLTQPFSFDENTVEQQLSENKFQPCSSQSISSQGWSSPLPNGQTFLHGANGTFLLCLKIEEKILPSSVINAQLEQKVSELEAEKQAPLSKAEKKELKENLISVLLPQAFSKFSRIYGFISPSNGLVVVDSSSDSKTELFLSTLRKSIESLPVLPLGKQSINQHLTDYIKHACPAPWSLNDEAELTEGGDDSGIIRCKRQDLTENEIIAHIDAGKNVSKLSVEWRERLNLIIQENLQIKRLKYADILLEQNDDIPKDQKLAKFDADFMLMSSEIIELIDDLKTSFIQAEE